MFKGFLEELLEDVAVARLRPTPTTQVFPSQEVNFSEQIPVISDVMLEFTYRPFATTTDCYTVGVFPL